ncbi:MAG TPA: PH domain-containing protein [Methanomicrobiales archaeon]|nr:PH domain-containing protein [Methanomicrobiales archaeon]
MERQDEDPGARRPVILETGPDPRGFMAHYLLAFTPLVLFLVSVAAAGVMRASVGAFTASLGAPVRAYLPWMGDVMEISVLLTAPVSLYAIAAIIGWRIRSPEMWAGAALALGLSALAGFLMATFSPDPSLGRALDILYWVSYLIGPVSIIAVILVLGFSEQFRRSIRYSITREDLILRGGIWKKRENRLPWHQIGGFTLEQGMLGKLLGRGTILPLMAGGQGPGSEKAGGMVSRSPLNCLYGVGEPGLVLEFLQELLSPPADGNV